MSASPGIEKGLACLLNGLSDRRSLMSGELEMKPSMQKLHKRHFTVFEKTGSESFEQLVKSDG